MKTTTFIVAIITALLQYKLWVAPGNVFDVMNLKQSVNTHVSKNQQLVNRNKMLEHEVHDLKYGSAALEERARQELGMVKDGETYYQFVEKS